MADDELARLRRDVQYLLDRTQILDCIARHARGCDRHDAGLILSTYHDDGIDEHGNSIKAGPDYAAWANRVHAATSQQHTHNITTHTCDIDGDTAHCESYVLVALLSPDGKSTQVMGGRYIDRLERREGAWRIAVRRSTVEWSFAADASLLQSPFFTEQHFLKGTRDKRDLSYERPLRLESPAPASW